MITDPEHCFLIPVQNTTDQKDSPQSLPHTPPFYVYRYRYMYCIFGYGE
jgi:hypothetical protein